MSIALPAKTGKNVYQTVAMGAICLVIGLFCMKPINPNRRIRDAVENRDFAAVESELKKGANPNARYSKKGEELFYSLLHCAVSKADPRITEVLLKAGATVDDLDSDGRTPLMACVLEENDSANVACSELLIRYGAGVNYETEGKTTPLHLAAEAVNTDHVKLLLRNGAKVNVVDSHGNTPLHNVCRLWRRRDPTRQGPTIQALLHSGADPSIRNRDGMTPRDILIRERRTELISEYDAACAVGNAQSTP